MEKRSQPLTNDTARLVPKTAFDVPVLEFDFPALQIGVAAYEEGPTGCTVFRFSRDPTSVIDVRGGFPGTIHGSPEEDIRTAAICFAGGSTYGVEAATGVAAELFAQSGYSDIKLVRGAITYDFWRDNKIYPDKALGRAVLKSARTGVFPLGRAGVGVSLTCGGGFGGSERTGQGGAFLQVGPTKIAVFTAVNAAGAIVDRQGQVVRGHLDRRRPGPTIGLTGDQSRGSKRGSDRVGQEGTGRAGGFAPAARGERIGNELRGKRRTCQRPCI
ncbi:MAG: hypothetical protein A3F84_17745 [Candidatus Handelsmanbacteria bacterium RIFCSPLOWO2_12_FULL_64_10]|uniref:Peptidase S58 DmpA n=1 Tax=Handelsmanbacteria sp. (strain RIFCSPLOWO2_12_FULL_64_10) TaxID=1817868 RepID=A0A1F6CR62_HANXR|nr:MAG: hypothetical protein A3F84_17745 [Candidatus Handelsmanbacteria bacterium RIFCSPLOWO2_12_FULL_64_10]